MTSWEILRMLEFKPWKELSLQIHKYRSEHWVVLSGNAKILRATENIFLRENESTYIPKGTKHKISNHSDAPLKIIEVQFGDYIGEDDIERFEDIYGRT